MIDLRVYLKTNKGSRFPLIWNQRNQTGLFACWIILALNQQVGVWAGRWCSSIKPKQSAKSFLFRRKLQHRSVQEDTPAAWGQEVPSRGADVPSALSVLLEGCTEEITLSWNLMNSDIVELISWKLPPLKVPTFPLGFLLHDFLLFLGSRDSVLQQKREVRNVEPREGWTQVEELEQQV